MIERGSFFAATFIGIIVSLGTVGSTLAQGTSATAFKARYGTQWRTSTNIATRNNVSFLVGGRVPSTATLRTSNDYDAAARTLVDENPELFGISSADLVLRRVKMLTTSNTNSPAKVLAHYGQVANGLAVVGAYVSILFDRDSSDIIAIHCESVPGVSRAESFPKSTVSKVVYVAGQAFIALTGVTHTSEDTIEPVILGPTSYFGKHTSLRDKGAVLAYSIELSAPGWRAAGGLPAMGRFIVSAEGDLTLYESTSTACGADGTVTGMASNSWKPSYFCECSEHTLVSQPLSNVYVYDNANPGTPLVTTDIDGEFDTSGSHSVYCILKGPYVQVEDIHPSGGNVRFPLTGGVSGSGLSIAFDPITDCPGTEPNIDDVEYYASQVAAFKIANSFVEWIKEIDSQDDTLDGGIQIHVNRLNIDSGCNGGYFTSNPTRIEVDESVYLDTCSSGGGCHNFANRTILIHELGHWARDEYNQGPVASSFNEGLADGWLYVMTGDPCAHSSSPGAVITDCAAGRNATQTQFKKCPQDGDVSCNGFGDFSKTDRGKPIASALFAVRDALESLGQSELDHFKELFLNWNVTYNDNQMLNVIQEHWLSLDDDNADLSDLTPYYDEISTAFRAYGWPWLGPRVSDVSAPHFNEELPPSFDITITARVNPYVGTLDESSGYEPRLHYSITGGSPSVVVMDKIGLS